MRLYDLLKQTALQARTDHQNILT